MSDKKTSTPFLDNLLGNTPNPTAGYMDVFALANVACANCKIAFAPNAPTFVEDKADLIAVAKPLHSAAVSQAKVLCSTPKLSISYVSVLMHKD